MSAASKHASKRIAMIGRYKGKGVVLDSGLNYKEELTIKLFKHKPMSILTYHSETWTDDEKKIPLHTEVGILKLSPEDPNSEQQSVEANFAHPFSLTEFEYGVYYPKELKLELELKHLQRGELASGKQTTGLKRLYWMSKSGELNYKMWLAVDNEELKPHLQATLEPISPF